MKKLMLVVSILLLLPVFVVAQATTYQLSTSYSTSTTFICQAASRYPISSPYQFNCNGVPLLENGTKVGSVQILNSSGTVQIHAPGIADPNQYLESKLVADMSQFSIPNAGGPGKVVFNFQITDTNNNVFHGVITAPWDDKLECGGRGCIWYAPELLTIPVDGTLTIEPGPLS